MRPEAARFAFRHETQPGREELENVGGLGNQELAGFQERRGKWGMFQRRVFEEFHDPGTAEVRIAGDIDVIRPGIFQRKANELATPLDRRLIVQFITHESPPEIANRFVDRLAYMTKLLNKFIARAGARQAAGKLFLIAISEFLSFPSFRPRWP